MMISHWLRFFMQSDWSGSISYGSKPFLYYVRLIRFPDQLETVGDRADENLRQHREDCR